DDPGNDAATATVLPAGSQLNASGVIEQNTDMDVFAFSTGAGPITINVNPATLSPNLDILAELFNSAGSLLASSNPSSSLSASFSMSVPAGKYYLRVRGTGYATPSTGYSNYPPHIYSRTGTSNPPLRVTDNDSNTSSGTLTITVTVAAPNTPPIARATATPASGYAPLTVTLNGSASSDPDGSIASYSWNFGDGGSASGATVQHAYQSSA